MSEAALDRLTSASDALIHALDQGSASDIEAATVEFGQAIEGIKAVPAWRDIPNAFGKLNDALALAETARGRVNYLTDLARRRFELLCNSAGLAPAVAGYDRHARLRG